VKNDVVLDGTFVRLEPLTLVHLNDLCAVGCDETLWQWTTETVLTPAAMRDYIVRALEEQSRGVALPFVTIEKKLQRVVGSTRFANIRMAHRSVEIGWTWIARPWQRTAINTEAKLLMLRHAFETLECIRVELKTDALNTRSRTAIARLGAKEEGIFRQHMITDSGRVRDTVYYSIVASEWPAVRERLQEKLLRTNVGDDSWQTECCGNRIV